MLLQGPLAVGFVQAVHVSAIFHSGNSIQHFQHVSILPQYLLGFLDDVECHIMSALL